MTDRATKWTLSLPTRSGGRDSGSAVQGTSCAWEVAAGAGAPMPCAGSGARLAPQSLSSSLLSLLWPGSPSPLAWLTVDASGVAAMVSSATRFDGAHPAAPSPALARFGSRRTGLPRPSAASVSASTLASNDADDRRSDAAARGVRVDTPTLALLQELTTLPLPAPPTLLLDTASGSARSARSATASVASSSNESGSLVADKALPAEPACAACSAMVLAAASQRRRCSAVMITRRAVRVKPG